MAKNVKHVKTQAEEKSVLFNMRVAPSFLEEIDDWRVGRRPVLSRSEAIRQLVERGLSR